MAEILTKDQIEYLRITSVGASGFARIRELTNSHEFLRGKLGEAVGLLETLGRLAYDHVNISQWCSCAYCKATKLAQELKEAGK